MKIINNILNKSKIDKEKDKIYRLILDDRMDEAKKHYLELLKFAPNDYEIHQNFAVLLSKLKHYEEAEIEYQKALNLNDKNAEIHKNYGNLLIELNRFCCMISRTDILFNFLLLFLRVSSATLYTSFCSSSINSITFKARFLLAIVSAIAFSKVSFIGSSTGVSIACCSSSKFFTQE